MLTYEGKEFSNLGSLRCWLNKWIGSEQAKQEKINDIINSYGIEFKGKHYETKEQLRLFLNREIMVYSLGSLHLFGVESPSGSGGCYTELMELILKRTDSFTKKYLRSLPLIIGPTWVSLLNVTMPRCGLFNLQQEGLIDKIICLAK